MWNERRRILEDENSTEKKTVQVLCNIYDNGETGVNGCGMQFPDDFFDDDYLDFDPSIFDGPVEDDEIRWWW